MRLSLILASLCVIAPAYGAQPLQFERPWGIVTTATGKQLVRDALAKGLLTVGLDGKPLATAGVKPDAFTGSFDIAMDKVGKLYTAKWGNDKDPRCGFVVQDATGMVVLAHLGLEGKTPGLVRTPMGVGVDKQGHIFIADTGNDRVQEFGTDGKLVAVIGAGELRLPMKVAFDRAGAMYVADSGKNRIAIYERDVDGAWLLMRTLEGVKEPVCAIVDGRGRTFVSTNRKAGVYMFDEKGEQTWKYLGTKTTRLSSPRGLAFDAKGNLLVVDESTRRVWKLKTPE